MDTFITDEQLLRELDAGLTRREIAAKYGYSIRTIQQRCQRLGRRITTPYNGRQCALCKRPIAYYNRTGRCTSCQMLGRVYPIGGLSDDE